MNDIVILKKNSILRYLPKELEKEQLLIFDALRISAEMIEHDYNQLKNMLEVVSKPKNKRGESIIFKYAWGVIDSTSRFVRLYKKLPSDSNYEILDKIDILNPFRNTIQHLDERINESLIQNNSPFFGILIWNYKNNEVKPYLLVSGIKYGLNVSFRYPDINSLKNGVNDIQLQTVNKKEIIQINLSQLVEDLTNVLDELDRHLVKQFGAKGLERVDWKHHKDIIISIKSKQ